MISPKAMKNGSTKDGVEAYIGTGPYVLDEFVTDEYAVFKANPNYWGEQPAIKTITVKVIPDNQTRILALEKGEIDMIFGKNMIDADAINQYLDSDQFNVELSDPTSTRQIVLNTSSDILSEKDVRIALQHATNKQNISDGIFYGLEKPADTLFASTVPYCDIELEPYVYDLELAGQILDEAGWKMGSGTGLAAAASQAEEGQTLDRWLLSQLLGFSPLLCRELSFRATGDAAKPIARMTDENRQQLGKVYDDFMSYVEDDRAKPFLLTKVEDGAVFDFTFLPVTQYEGLMNVTQADSFSALLAAFFEKKGKAERMQRRTGDLHKTVTNARDRVARKLAAQKKELAATHNREQYKRTGELITANLYQLEKGMNKAKVVDYYAESCPEVEITLDVRLTPQQNAQKYFKLYNKAKTAEEVLTQQIEQGTAELDYLESVLAALSEAENERDLAQLREELTQSGVLSAKQTRNKKLRGKPAQAKPFHYRTSDGFDVFAGKNNLQNDLLTLKTAFKSDIWFHTQKIHGSHVILVTDGREPTDEAMTEAAMIAAYHSRGRSSSLVPVDYTPVRQVKKPAGAKPGMVIYHVYQTAYVTPDEAEVEKLRVE